MGLSVEAAAELRDHMAAALAAAASGVAAVRDDVDEQYGGKMWARCEALTAGAVLFGVFFFSFGISCVRQLWTADKTIRLTGTLELLNPSGCATKQAAKMTDGLQLLSIADPYI